MKYQYFVIPIFVLTFATILLADEGYIRNTRWHVRPWKSITQSVDDIEDEKQVAQLAPSNLVRLRNSVRERRDDESYIYGTHDTPVNPFVQKILNLIKEKSNTRPWLV